MLPTSRRREPDSRAPSLSGDGVRLQILGPLRLWRDDAELEPASRQQAFLLALLLARVGSTFASS